jgi:oxygen-independent coproporphyrinogen-3 oxidase
MIGSWILKILFIREILFGRKILAKIAEKFTILKNCEISLEANPTSVEAQKFVDLKKIGVNRLSLGIQALNDIDLKFLGREHSVNEAENAIKLAQKYFI